MPFLPIVFALCIDYNNVVVVNEKVKEVKLDRDGMIVTRLTGETIKVKSCNVKMGKDGI